MSLTILSYGGGQDSTAILDRELQTGGLNVDAVVFSDTGNEHPHTYETVARMQKRCEKAGLVFAWLKHGADGFHSDAWPSLTGQWEAKGSITSRAFGKSCTDNLKIKPIYKWLNAHCAELLGEEIQDNGKKNILSWVEKHGKIAMIIGIAKGEEKRLGGEFPQKWAQNSIERIYPLVAWGWDRQACQDYLGDAFLRVGRVWPSNCLFCHYQSDQELLWLSRRYPERYREWVGHEARKIEKYQDRDGKNYGVYGAKLLPVKLIEAEEKHGHLSDRDLDEYKFGHGHTIPNAY